MKTKTRKILPTRQVKTESGFTIIESLVAMFIFIITIGATVGAFTFSLTAQRLVFAEKQVSESVNFSLEFMTRQLRVAQRDLAGSCITVDKIFEMVDLDGDGDSDQITFINADDLCVRFTLNLSDNSVEYIEDPLGTPDTIKLTNSEIVSITDIDFETLGEPSNDSIQSRVTVAIRAEGVGASEEAQSVNLETQTTVTSRRLDTL
ncbi:MAG: hypothetical protein R3346_01785 [Candidatus Spechtbacterales bacterium]|nr:hypothetical protein [Candidatus Spechtbacterales bacterium]